MVQQGPPFPVYRFQLEAPLLLAAQSLHLLVRALEDLHVDSKTRRIPRSLVVVVSDCR